MMEAFLRHAVDQLVTATAGGAAVDVHVVVGSEACDLDSAVSALSWAYYLSQTDAAAASAIVVPVLAVRRRDYAATRAVPRAHLQGECSLAEDLLVFLDDIDLAALATSGRLTLTLVDHNDVAAWHGSGDIDSTVTKVQRIIDHHRRSDRAFPAGCDIIIEPVGSCSTLVAERVLANAKVSSDRTLLKMLYGAIVYDTVCLSPSDGRTTVKDESAVLAIEAALGHSVADRHRLFDTLCRAKSDLTGIATADLLLSDKKVVAGPHTRLLVPSVTVAAQSLLGRTAFADDLRRVTADERCSAAVVMTLGGLDASRSEADAASDETSPLRRHLIIDSPSSELLSWITDALLASDLKAVENSDPICGLRVLVQSDHRQSRKQVLPLLQKVILDFDARTSADGSGLGMAPVPLLTGEPTEQTRLPPAAPGGLGSAAEPDRGNSITSQDAGPPDPFESFVAASLLSLSSSRLAWPPAGADSGSQPSQTTVASSADFFSFDSTFGGGSGASVPQAGDGPADLTAMPHSSQQLQPKNADLSDPFALGDLLSDDVTMMAKHEEAAWLTAVAGATAAPAAAAAADLASESNSSGGSNPAGVAPSPASSQPNPFLSSDPFGANPFTADPFGSTGQFGVLAGNPFGSSSAAASAVATADPFGDLGGQFGGSQFGVNPFGLPASSGDPLGFGSQPNLSASAEADASLLIEADLFGPTAFADRVTVASTPNRDWSTVSASGAPFVDDGCSDGSGGAASSGGGGSAIESEAAASGADGTLVPTAGSTPSSGVVDDDLVIAAPATTTVAAAGSAEDEGPHHTTTEHSDRGTNTGQQSEGRLVNEAGATQAPLRDLSLPPSAAEGAGDAGAAGAVTSAAAAYDDEAFGGRTSTESSSPTTDGSAPSKYSFLSPSADLFRLTFVPDEARGSSVSSVDSAAAGTSLPADFPAAALAELAEFAAAADAAAATTAIDVAAVAGPPEAAYTSGDVGSAAVQQKADIEADGSKQEEDADSAGRAAAAVTAGEQQALTTPTMPATPTSSLASVAQQQQLLPLATAAGSVQSANFVVAAAAGGSRSPELALLPLPRTDLEGSLGSSSVPGTPNNSYYDSGMFDKFAAFALDGHTVTSRILQHQVKHEGATPHWLFDEGVMETAVATAGSTIAAAAAAAGAPATVGVDRGSGDASQVQLAVVSAAILSSAAVQPGSAQDDGEHLRPSDRSLRTVSQRHDGVSSTLPLTPANSFADSFRLPDGGWPSETGSGVKDPLSQLSSNEVLQKVLQKKAALIRDSEDTPGGSGGRGGSTPGTPSPGGFDSVISDRSSSHGVSGGGSHSGTAVRRRSVDSRASEEGMFEFDADDADVAGSAAVANGAAIAAMVTVGQPSTGQQAAGGVGTAEAATFVNYLASVDPLRGHLDLVADSARAVPLSAPPSAGSTAGGITDAFKSGRATASLGGSALSMLAPAVTSVKRHSIAGRLEAQIVEGVDIEELTASDATAAALVRRASLDSVGSTRRMLTAATVPLPTKLRTVSAAASTSPLARADRPSEDGDGSEHRSAALESDNVHGSDDSADIAVSVSPVSTAGTEQQPGILPSAVAAASAAAVSAEERAAERIVANAMCSALAMLNGEVGPAAADHASAIAADGSAVGDSDLADACSRTAQNLVSRVLAEAKERLTGAAHGPSASGHDETAGGNRKYSDWMIDAVLGKADDSSDGDVATATSAIAGSVEAQPDAAVEESLVPTLAGTVAAAAPSGLRVLRPDSGGGAAVMPNAAWASPSTSDGSLEAALAALDDMEAADDSTASFIDPSVLQELGDVSSDSAASSGGVPTVDQKQQQQPFMDTIPLDSSDEAPADWCTVTVAGREHHVNMTAIKPFCKLISHGGLYNSDSCSVLLVFTASYFPSRSLKNYSYVMDNLLLYVLSGIELMVPEGRDFAILYFHGGADKSQLPSMAFLKRCRDEAHTRLRKSLKMLFLVHPTVWLRSVVLCSRAIVSSKFSRKIVYVPSLETLRKVLSLEYVTVPSEVVEFDRQRSRAKK